MNSISNFLLGRVRSLPWTATALAVVLLGAAAPRAQAEESVAREWNELLLATIRKDFARPTVHARNLYHTSAAMWDAWATYDENARGVLFTEKHVVDELELDAKRHETISYAMLRILKHRFASSPAMPTLFPQYDAYMADHGYDIGITTTVGDSAAAIGNRIAATVIAYGLSDGSNEANGYANQFYFPKNDALIVVLLDNGNPNLYFPNLWQPLALSFFIDQAGNPIPGGFPPFLSPEWGRVKPFSLTVDDLDIYNKDGYDWWVYHDPGPPPMLGEADEHLYKSMFEMTLLWSSHLDPNDGVMIDASPNSIGNNPPLPTDFEDYDDFYDFLQGGDSSIGYERNPVTDEPYEVQMVPRGDYTRCLAEFWADGPASETPPGHWFSIFNHVADDPRLVKKIGGVGPVVDDLEWDVKGYLALGGAMHDSAVSTWGVKGYYDYVRPVSAIRYMAGLGQSTDTEAANYHPHGLPLVPGYVQTITAADTAPGGPMEHLAGKEGKIAARAWRGPTAIADPLVDTAGVGWILATDWWPYQRPTFVSPPFAGYLSGHSTYSRAGAVVMHNFTGTKWFPGGLGEFECPQNEYLVFEEGPSVTVKMQWATYYDASDQCSLSRIWGGIHPPQDDINGRINGQKIGTEALAKASEYWNGTWCDLGHALAGTGGAPALVGSGTLQPHSACALDLSNGKPSAAAVLFASLVGNPLPFKGGTLVPTPVALALNMATSPSGTIHLPFAWPAGVPSGTELYIQIGIQDAGGPAGVALSNAVQGTTP